MNKKTIARSLMVFLNLLCGVSFVFAPLAHAITFDEIKAYQTGGRVLGAYTFTAPEMPRSYVDTTLPASSSTCTVNLTSGGNLQAALDNANLGDTICLQAGTVFTGNFLLRNKTTGSGWITIRTSTPLSQLPAAGSRTTPTDVPKLAKLVAPNASPALQADPGAHNYRIVGLEVVPDSNSINYNLVLIVPPSFNSTSGIPSDFIFDHVYVHGFAQSESARGIWVGGQRMAVINSYISDIHSINKEAQAILVFGGPGPYKFVNNYLEAAGENLFFGEPDATTNPLMIPKDIEVRNNYIFKPLAWQNLTPSWVVKNLLEFKSGNRAIIENNILENSWPQSQDGTSVLFTPRTAYGLAPWNEVSNITFRNNIIQNGYKSFSAQGIDNYCTNTAVCVKSNGILIQNNLLKNLHSLYSDFGYGGGFVAYDNFTFDHNTVVNIDPLTSPLSTQLYIGDPITKEYNFAVTNNIFKGGFLTDGLVGKNALAIVAPDSLVSANVIAGVNPISYDQTPVNYFPAAVSDVGFVDPNGGNYHLAASSPYKNQATDGKDIGVDIDAVVAATAGVITGDMFVPPPPAQKYPRLITLTTLEALSSIPANQPVTVTILSGSTVLETQNLTPNANKQYTMAFLSTDPKLVNIRIKATRYLSQLLANIDTTVNSASALTVPQLLAGDSNNDNTVNSLDYSVLNSHWNQNYPSADINIDGLVNSLDFAVLKNNYNKTGQ